MIDYETQLGTCRIAFDGIGGVPHLRNDECIDWEPELDDCNCAMGGSYGCPVHDPLPLYDKGAI